MVYVPVIAPCIVDAHASSEKNEEACITQLEKELEEQNSIVEKHMADSLVIGQSAKIPDEPDFEEEEDDVESEGDEGESMQQ